MFLYSKFLNRLFILITLVAFLLLSFQAKPRREALCAEPSPRPARLPHRPATPARGDGVPQ